MQCYGVVRVFLGIVLLAPAMAAGAADVPTADFYVAPGGKDTWSGRLAEPKPDGSDGPLATIVAVRDAVRRLKAQDSAKQPIRVLLRGGTYAVTEPMVFSAEDSGAKEAPITYAAYPGEKPVISGGAPIADWQKAEGPLWTTVVPAVKDGQRHFRSLFVDGKRCTPARTPNEDWHFTAGPAEPIDRQNREGNAAARRALRYKNDDVKPWSNLDDAIAVVYHVWTASRHHIASIDSANKIVHFSNPSAWPMGWWGAERYYVENVREALDAPGEFYLDRKTGLLTYYPRPGEDMTKAQVVAPHLQELLRLEGPVAGKQVEFLKFEGLGFEYTDWAMPREEIVDGQAAAFLTTAAVFARGARNCAFERCEIAHIGGYGLWFERGCKDNRLAQCQLCDLGAGGVRIGESHLPDNAEERAERNEVFNCFIHDGGRVFQAGVGVWIGMSSYNKVRHNEICDLLYSGISVGWSWGYGSSSTHHNTIERNHIHHLGWGKLSDMGGVYSLGISTGTIVRNNLVHDVSAFSYGGWGLYLDEGSTDMLLENNIVYRVQDGGFNHHYGRENLVRNNIFAFSATAGQVGRSREESHRSFTFDRNIVYYRQGDLLFGNWGNGQYRMDNNCYWNATGKMPTFPGRLSLKQWQTSGQDVHSVVADPKFVDADRFDFRLNKDSPALKLGFQPIDVGGIGLVGPIEWVALPKQVRRPPLKLPGEVEELILQTNSRSSMTNEKGRVPGIPETRRAPASIIQQLCHGTNYGKFSITP